MTNMNYEKKYKEALNWMRELYPGLHGETKVDAEYYFPELKESEDERIRKELIGLISCMHDADPRKKRWIAYLEKQKEQPQEELVYRMNGLMQEYVKEGEDDAEKEHRLKCYQLFWDALEDADFFVQKEQKPSINIDQLKSMMLQYLQEAANEKEDSDIEADTDKWARKILGYDFEQKPADEQFPPLEGLDAIKAKYYDNGFKNGFDEGVESVKPAEWSEEDEAMIDDIIFSLPRMANGSIEILPSVAKSYSERLKSLHLQLHWKPSEEQMEALSETIAFAPDTFKPKCTLVTLQDDLKNL